MLFTGFTPAGLWSQGDLRCSQGPREPHYAFALLSDPGRTSAPRLFAALRCCPRELHDEGSSDKYPFETQSHGFGIHYLRFVPPFLTTTQDSLPEGGQPFPGGIGYPLSSFEQFRLRLPCSWAFPGARSLDISGLVAWARTAARSHRGAPKAPFIPAQPSGLGTRTADAKALKARFMGLSIQEWECFADRMWKDLPALKDFGN